MMEERSFGNHEAYDGCASSESKWVSACKQSVTPIHFTYSAYSITTNTLVHYNLCDLVLQLPVTHQ